jgi:hypothetical protein
MVTRRDTFRAACDGKLKLTDEEKVRWGQFLHQCWGAIAPDAEQVVSRGRGRVAEIIEMTLDANRMTTFTKMTPEEEGVLCGLWIKKDRVTMKWLRQQLNY